MAYKSVALVMFALLGLTPAAQAGIYTDDLSKCLVKATTDDEKRDLVLWIFSAISAHPAVRPFSNITPEQRNGFDKHAGALMTRLVTDTCHTEAVSALKFEGGSALSASFEVLGQVAARSLMTEPDVGRAMSGMATFVDMDKWNKLSSEAGLAPTDNAKPVK